MDGSTIIDPSAVEFSARKLCTSPQKLNRNPFWNGTNSRPIWFQRSEKVFSPALLFFLTTEVLFHWQLPSLVYFWFSFSPPRKRWA